MPSSSFEHLIYAPVPYKGYGIRAWSSGANQDEFKDAFSNWFVPFDQSLFRGNYEARVVIRTPTGKVFLSRIFLGSKLDELNREGVVSHVVAMSHEFFRQGLTFEEIEHALVSFQQTQGIKLGEFKQLELSWEGGAADPELVAVKSLIPEESARKILQGFDRKYAKLLVIYKKNPWDRIRLLFGICKMLLMHGLMSFSVMSDRPKEEVTYLLSDLLIVSDVMPTIRTQDEWTIVNLSKKLEQEKRSERSVDETIRTIYGNLP